MNRQTVAIVIARVIGVYVLIQSIEYLHVLSWGLSTAPPEQSSPTAILILRLLVFLLFLGLGIYLFLAPAAFARFLIRESSASEDALKIDLQELTIAAFSVVGLVLSVRAVTILTRWAVLLLGSETSLSGLPSGARVDLIGGGVQLALGLWLLLESRGIVNAIQKLRRAGT